MRRGILLTLAAAALVFASAGCGSKSETPGVRVIEAHAYRVDSSVESALDFFANEHVFEGTVTARGQDTRVTDRLPSGNTIEAVYTPVTVVVDRAYRGGLAAGTPVVVRSLGGEVDGLRYNNDDVPAKDTFALGTRLVLFASDYSAVDSESVPAMTPHFVYRYSDGAFVDATYTASGFQGQAPDDIQAADLRLKLSQLAPVK
jgi:hypothetical protein